MKVPLAIDATLDAGVRAILAAYADIDWFGPARSDDAATAFREHLACAHRHDGVMFPPASVETVTGDWDDFVELCTSVRERPGWDWKYGGLKQLTAAHSRARGWVIDDQPAAAGLWLRLPNGATIWTLRSPDAALAVVPDAAREQATFYLSYANMDVIEAVQWQLGDGHDDLSDNPFVPLLATYAAGGFPFCMDQDEFVLFELDQGIRATRS